MSLLKDGEVLSATDLEEPFVIIKKNFKYPLKYKVMEAFDNGLIVLIHGEPRTKLPTCLPFFLTKNNKDQVVAVISADIYGVMDKNGDFKIDPKKLYCLMEGAYLARLHYFYEKQISSRPVIISHGSAIYAAMFVRVLNKKYALNINKSKYNAVIFLASKFYMINVLGLPNNEIVFNYAIKNCPNANLISLQELDSAFEDEYFLNLETFIKALAIPEMGIGLKDLTVRGYLEAFINMYDASNLLSLEMFPYFMYNVLSVTNGAFINNQYVLEDIVGNSGAKMYNDLMSLDK